MHVHDSQGCPEFSVVMLYISFVDRENNHELIDGFVFFPVAKEAGRKKETEIDAGSESDQGIGVFIPAVQVLKLMLEVLLCE